MKDEKDSRNLPRLLACVVMPVMGNVGISLVKTEFCSPYELSVGQLMGVLGEQEGVQIQGSPFFSILTQESLRFAKLP